MELLNPEPSSDRMIETLPRWLLRHIVKPENHRHVGKKPQFYSEYRDGGYYSRGPSHYDQPRICSRIWDYKLNKYVDMPRNVVEIRRETPHLDTNDYRLWAQVRWPGTDTQLIMARCRWCHERFPLREFKQVRQTHKETCNFTHNLREVYQILLQKGQCVVCERHTGTTRWGIPLCREECEQTWMFATEHSQRLACAIIDARVAKRIRENEPRNASRRYAPLPT